MSFFEELKRRNVVRVGIAYVLLGWVVLQAADFALDLIDAPNWIIQAMFIIGLTGLPIALFFAWAFEITPEGIKREADVDRSASVAPHTGRKLDRAIIAFLALALVLVLGERVFFARQADQPPTQVTESTSDSNIDAKSVAVLPFDDMSQAGDQKWFADGLAEEILNSLVRVPDLRVASRTSSFKFRDSQLSVLDIAEELGVAHILEGSVRSSGDRIRVTAQLIRAEDGFHVFSENYDRDVSDMISIQEDLARNIASALQTSMDPEALRAMASVGTQSINAYKEYLKGLQLRGEGLAHVDGQAQSRAAYELFERARELDASFSNAHFNAADYWRIQLDSTRAESGQTNLTAKEMLAEYQVRLDAAKSSARSETDRLFISASEAEIDLRFRDSLRDFQKALASRPNDSETRFRAIGVASVLDDSQAGRELLAPWLERGLSDPESANGVVSSAFRVIDRDEAADLAYEYAKRWPNDTGLLYQAHRTLLWAGRRLEASEIAARFRANSQGPNPILEAREACAMGDRDAAELILAGLEGENDRFSTHWLINDLLGNQQAIRDVLRPLEEGGVPMQLASLLEYEQFDPSSYPSVVAVLEREGINSVPLRTPFACPPPEKTSIAVLAFENMSPDPENEFFADGISEEILNVLSPLKDLRVIARTSAFSFKGSGATISEIADKLDVGYVLEGSVRRSGNRVRVTAQLIETNGESHLWSETYDRDLNDIFAVQDDIARAISNELQIQLTPNQQQVLASELTQSTEAYNQYLIGRQLWHRRNFDNLMPSAEALRRAVELDPEFAEAWAALADTLVLLPEYNTDGNTDSIPAARDALNRALELKPNLAQALTTRAYIRFVHDYDWDNAERDFQRAMQLDPGYATAKQWYGEYLAVRFRDVDGALEMFREGAKLDPLAPIMWHVAGWIASGDNRFEEAQGLYDRALAINPSQTNTLSNLIVNYIRNGKFDEARATGQRLKKVGGHRFDLETFTVLIDGWEDPEKLNGILDFIQTTDRIADGATGRAMWYMLLEKPDLAMENLEKGLETGDAYAVHVNRMRVYDPLRENPRFQAHLAKLNLWPPE